VIDFSVIKQVVGGWIDEHWDHAFIYYDADEAVKSFMANGGGRSFSMKCEPTAENMSQFLLEKSRDLLKPFGIDVVKLRLYETPNCWAEAV
jgi:6-pyruvoyltetrahydropterin/6-carboxytetrahydropterin synthase